MTAAATCENPARSSGVLRGLVAAYAALLPFQFEVGTSVNFAPADCALLLVMVLAAGQLRYRKEVWPAWHFGLMLTLVLGSWITVQRLGTLARYEVLNKDAGLLLPFLSYAAITSLVAEWEDVRYLLRVFTLSVVIENCVAVAGFLASYFLGVADPFVRYDGLRLSGMLIDPNAYGGLLVTALAIAEGGSYGPAPLFGKKTLLVIRGTLGLGILFTFSRSAWLALALSLVVLLALRTRQAGRLVLAGLVGAPLTLLLMGRRFLPIFEVMAARPKQVEGRFTLIRDALAAFSRHPLFGGGIGSFRLSEGEIAHNSAMWFLADFGVAGLAVLLGFLGWFFVKGWFAYRHAPLREQPVVLAVLLAHTAMFGLAMGIEALYQRHWWLVFGLIASVYSLTLRRLRQLECRF